MKNINNIIFLFIAMFGLISCGNDDASNPTFRDDEIPRIYGDWSRELSAATGDVLDIDLSVSPSDEATYTWTLGGEVISTERHLQYTIPDDKFGLLELKFEVKRYNEVNHRQADMVIAKSTFVPKEYVKKSVGFITRNGSIDNVPWGDITHLVVSSAQIEPTGLPNVDFGDLNLSLLLILAHNEGVYVILSYSGEVSDWLTGALPYQGANMYSMATSDVYRDDAIEEMLTYAANMGFDGINIHMDKSTSGDFPNPPKLREFYEVVAERAPAETERGKFYLTMSSGTGWTKGAIGHVVDIERYDLFFSQSYGSEALTPGHHASLSLFNSDARDWVNYGMAAEKMIPTAPAFGIRYFGEVDDYTWGNLYNYVSYSSYRELVDSYDNVPESNYIPGDQITPNEEEGEQHGIYYDGLNEIDAKVQSVIDNGYGGMGLWSIESDHSDADKSLMRRINDKLGN